MIRRPKVVDGYEFRAADWTALQTAGEDVWLLDPEDLSGVPDSLTEFREQAEGAPSMSERDSVDDANTLAYLRTAITKHDLSSTSTIEQGDVWYRPPSQPTPCVIVPDSSRAGFPFVYNETEARNIHNYHGVFDISVDETQLKAILVYLNSSVGQHVVHQQTVPRADGYERLGVQALKDLPVIDPTELSDGVVRELAAGFDALRETARHTDDREVVRDHIDTLLDDHLALS